MLYHPFTPRIRTSLRAVAFWVAASVLIQDLAFAAGPDLRRPSTAPSILKTLDAHDPTTRGGWGQTTHRRRFKDADLVINIQDAHASLSAQTSIGRALDEFDSAYDLELIGVEGSSGRLDTDLISALPDARVRTDVADGLLRKTMISAAEYRQIVQGGTAELYGVEDAELHRRNARDFRRLLDMKRRARQELERVRAAVESADLERLPAPVPDIHRLSNDHSEGRIPFAEYWEALTSKAEGGGTGLFEEPSIRALDRALALEREIDFDRASAQREAAVRAVKDKVFRDERARFLRELRLFRDGRTRPASFHRHLVEWTEDRAPGIAIGELKKYSAYLGLLEKIDLTELFGAIRKTESALIKGFLRTEEHRKAYSRLVMTGLLARLYDGAMTTGDLTGYLELRGASGWDDLKAAAGDDAADWAFLFKAERAARAFYVRARSRDRAMLDRLTSRMREKGVRTAALVTGGFHAEGLTRLMEQRRVSHVVVLPEFDASGPARPYAAVIRSKGAYLSGSAREAALAEIVASTLWSASVQGMSLPRIRSELERGALRIQQRQRSGPVSGSGGTGPSASDETPASDWWIAPASVLANIDAASAARMVKDAEIDGTTIRVGGYVFEGMSQTVTTAGGTRRRKASVRPVGEDAPRPDETPLPEVPAVRILSRPSLPEAVVAAPPAPFQKMEIPAGPARRGYKPRYIDPARDRPAAARMARRPSVSILWAGGILGIAAITAETLYFSENKIDPSGARYREVSAVVSVGSDPVAAGPPAGPRTFDPIAADTAVRDWVQAHPVVRQRVQDRLTELEDAAAKEDLAGSAAAVTEAEGKELLAEQSAIEHELDLLEARALTGANILDAKAREIRTAADTIARFEAMLEAKRSMVRAVRLNDPEAAEKRAAVLRARADAAALRAQAAEAEKQAATSGSVAKEYRDGGKFLRRITEGFSIGLKGPVPEVSFSPFAGKTERKVGEAGSLGGQAEALVRARGAWEQAEILDRVADSQETALRAYQSAQTVASDDARDPQIAAALRDLYDIRRDMARAEEELQQARVAASTLDSGRAAVVAKQIALAAREDARIKRLRAADAEREAARNRRVSAAEKLIVSSGAAFFDPSGRVDAPELAGELLGLGAAHADLRLLPFASELLMSFEAGLPDSISNPAQRRAAQDLADRLREYFGAVLNSSDGTGRRTAAEAVRVLRERMERDMGTARPLANAILRGLEGGPAARGENGPPEASLLLVDPGVNGFRSGPNPEHREEAAQILAVLEPIFPTVDDRRAGEVERAFRSGNFERILALAASSDEATAVESMRRIAGRPDLTPLLFKVARDPGAAPRVRAAAIESLARVRGAGAAAKPANDPLLVLIDELISVEMRPSAEPSSGVPDPFVLSRLARLAGSLTPSQALPFLERILRSASPPAVYAAAVEIRHQAASPEAVRPLLDALAAGEHAYDPRTRDRVLGGLGLWSDRSPVQQAILAAVFELSSRHSGDASVRSAIDSHRRAALREHRTGMVEYVLDPARSLADPDRSSDLEDLRSRAAVWFYNRFDVFAVFFFVVAGVSVLRVIGRKVRDEVEGSREAPEVRGYEAPHHPDGDRDGARMASLDLENEAERILIRSLETRFGAATAEKIRAGLGTAPAPSDADGWMRMFPETGPQILSELRAIRTSPIDLIEARLTEWERILDSDRSVAPAELSASIFSLFQQLMIRLPQKFDHQNFYKKLADTRDGVINIRTVARTVKALQKTDELLRREWKRLLEGRTLVLDRDATKWSLMALQRQQMRTYRAFGAAQELFELAQVALTYNDYRMHPLLMRLFMFEAMKRKGIELLTRGPGGPRHKHHRGVLDDYYRSIGRQASPAELKRDVKAFIEDFSDHYRQGLEAAKVEGNYVFSSRVVGRRYRRLVTVLMPAFGIAAGFLLGGPVFGLPALFRAFFLGSLGLLASRWIHKESFYRPLTMNYEHYVSTVVDFLAERNRLFSTAFHIAEFADGPERGTYIESDAFVPRVLLNSAQERKKAVVSAAASERPADLLLVMAGDPGSDAFEAVRRRVLRHELIDGSDTPVIVIPDDPKARGGYFAFLKAHAVLAGGVSAAEVVQRLMSESWFLEWNGHLMAPDGTSVRDDIRKRLLREHHRKIGSPEDRVRVGVLYAGGGREQAERVLEHVDEALVRVHAGLLWAKRIGRSMIVNEYADGMYAGPLPFYDSPSLDGLEAGEVLFPLTWVNAGQIERDRAAVFLPDPTGREIAEAIPGGLNADERRNRMNQAWMRAESPFTKFQLGSTAPQFLTDTGAFYFSPEEGTLELIEELRRSELARADAKDEGAVPDQDGAGRTVEQFFVERLKKEGRVRVRALISPPEASRYDHAVSRAERSDLSGVSRGSAGAVKKIPADQAAPPSLTIGPGASHGTESGRTAGSDLGPGYSIDLLMDGRLRVRRVSGEGAVILLGLNGTGYQGTDGAGSEWRGRWSAELGSLVLSNERGDRVLPAVPAPVRDWIVAQTARQARGNEGARLSEQDVFEVVKHWLGLMMRTDGGGLDDAEADGWIDRLIAQLPAVVPQNIQSVPGGYRLGPAQVSGLGLSERGIARMMGRSLTASSGKGQAVRRAMEAGRSLARILDTAAHEAADPEAADADVRVRLRRILKETAIHYRRGLESRTSIDLPSGPHARVRDRGRIVIEAELYFENQGFFNSESAALTERIKGASSDLEIVLAVPLTSAIRALEPELREPSYRRSAGVGDGIRILFTDPEMSPHDALETDGRPQAVLTQMASDLAQADMPRNAAVIELQPVDGAFYTGALYAAAKFLIQGEDRLPGMKKITEGRYFYFAPLGPGALLRAILAARLAAEEAGSAA